MGAEPGNGGLRAPALDGTRSVRVGAVDWFEGSRQGRDWPGKGFGIRPPVEGETPLSSDEVNVALRLMWAEAAARLFASADRVTLPNGVFNLENAA